MRYKIDFSRIDVLLVLQWHRDDSGHLSDCGSLLALASPICRPWRLLCRVTGDIAVFSEVLSWDHSETGCKAWGLGLRRSISFQIEPNGIKLKFKGQIYHLIIWGTQSLVSGSSKDRWIILIFEKPSFIMYLEITCLYLYVHIKQGMRKKREKRRGSRGRGERGRG